MKTPGMKFSRRDQAGLAQDLGAGDGCLQHGGTARLQFLADGERRHPRARAGMDDGKYHLIGGSSICSPEGHVVAEAKTDEDELVVADIDLDDCRPGKERTFNYGKHRRVETYGLITQQTSEIEPELLS